ncbi:hypothetical protein DXA27_03185 [Bacteroides fragilis]|uniref:Uncharacterized protein n=2 Tax=Bacteroides fragilis TaxID=817 RepID=A0A413K505_BACFG|nr:hypothetical protein DXA27_03185 [Bacteroides fragilis]
MSCIGKSRTFAPAFQEKESLLKLTCCKSARIRLRDLPEKYFRIYLVIYLKSSYLCRPIRKEKAVSFLGSFPIYRIV